MTLLPADPGGPPGAGLRSCR